MQSLGFLVAVCVSVAAAASIADSIANHGDADCQCQEIPGSTCALHFGLWEWHARFPNARGLDLTASIGEFFHFQSILNMDNYCSHMLYNLLCFHYFPQCDPNSERPRLGVTPCCEVCVEAIDSCVRHARAIWRDFEVPDHLNCDNFASGSQCDSEFGVIGEGDEECDALCTACPRANIHLEFATEAGKRTFVGSESTGEAKICLRLANVGSYNQCDRLSEAVTVNLQSEDVTAEEGLDYTGLNSNIVFPVGALKGEVRCITLPIVVDSEQETKEIFTVHATITSPPDALFGGSIADRFGAATVEIIDQFPQVQVPTAGPQIKVEFVTEEGKDWINSSNGSVEICLKMVNVGSYDPTVVLSENVTVHLSACTACSKPICSKPVQTTEILFPVGTLKEDVDCVTFQVPHEGEVAFRVHAIITSPLCALFGDCQSTAGSIEVRTVDQPPILVEFATEEGKDQFIGSERSEVAEVCLRLVNVGSCNPNDTLQENVTVNLCPQNDSAELGVDFFWQSSDIVFSIGAPKGEVQCVTIDIVKDDEKEGTEVFLEYANITSPCDALFGDHCLQSTTGSIKVKITDFVPILVEFATEEGEDQFIGSERSEVVEVCLRLVNVGSCNPDDTLQEDVTVNLCPQNDSAELGVDFFWQSSDIVFSIGAPKGEVQCVTIDIVKDDEKEGTEVFREYANITSPCDALFGDYCLQSTTGSIEVNITDFVPILVDFATEEYEDQFFGLEKNGSAEVCLKLVNVGSCNPDHTLQEKVIVNLYPVSGSAEQGLDFLWQSSDIVFPVGAIKGDVKCVTIDIVTDTDKEGAEVFYVHAAITCPSDALFGDTSLQSTTGSIEVNITDHCVMPDPVIPEDECKRECKWRTGINKKTFENNPYTFAAHIRVLGCRGSVVDVDIVDCRDITCGVCPQAGKFKIAYCPNCFTLCPTGEEFIVAGLNTVDSLYIANYKKGGVWAPEDTIWLSRVPPCT